MSAASITYDDVVAWITLTASRLAEAKAYLTDLDSAIGDADHGTNMDKGFQAVLTKLPAMPSGDIGALLKGAGSTLVSTVGGASGPLYWGFFTKFGGTVAGKAEIDVTELATGLEAGIADIQNRGKAEPGDKTMLDTLFPARDALRAGIAEGLSPADALAGAVAAAEQGMTATIPLVARKGRASYLGERSAGHQDPGATSSHLLLKAMADVFFTT